MKEKRNSFEMLSLNEGKELGASLLPRVTTVIAAKNHAAEIGTTLESLLAQEYPSHEIIVVDAGSTDRTLEVVKNFRSEKIRLLSVSSYNSSDMWNRGLLASEGDYINFLEPGTLYLFNLALRHMMELALSRGRPLLVYAPYLKRWQKGESTLSLFPLEKRLLKRGLSPTSFEACWFSIDAFRKAGTFSTEYRHKGGFEFLMRLSNLEGGSYASTTRVVTDAPIRLRREREWWGSFKEMWRAIQCHFGTRAALRWLMRSA